MPLIEIINITILAFSVGLLALMGISYLIYKYHDSSIKTSNHLNESVAQPIPKVTVAVPNPIRENPDSSENIPRYQIINTQIQSTKSENNKNTTAEKFIVVNRSLPSVKTTHSPKIIYLVNSPSKR